MFAIPALGRWRREGGEFKVIFSYVKKCRQNDYVRTSLKKKKKLKQKTDGMRREEVSKAY